MNFKLKEGQDLQDILQNDNIYPESKLIDLSDAAGYPCRKGCSKAVVSAGRIVNVVSPEYTHTPNEQFFGAMEEKLAAAGVKYARRAINRDNESFAVDYILNDPSYHIEVKKGTGDVIKPMIRQTNAYNGKGLASGWFGIFREVCLNGNHVAEQRVGFRTKHTRQMAEVIVPGMDELIKKFMDNEFYSLHKKFEVMSEVLIPDVHDFVKFTATELGLFKFEKGEKNPEPSTKAQEILDTIAREAEFLKIEPNLWLGYNAFNEALHVGKKSFLKQKATDHKLFETVYQLATN